MRKKSREPFPHHTAHYGSSTFHSEVVDALLKDNVCVLTNLPEPLEQAITALFRSGDDFYDNLTVEAAKTFAGTAEKFQGLIKSNKFPKICNSLRFFTEVGKDSVVKNEIMPTMGSEEVMRDSVTVFDKHAREIIAALSREIEKRFSIKEDALTRALGHSLVNLSRYTPTTQEIIRAMFENKVLVMTKEEEGALQFIPHKDLPMFTLVAYRQTTTGLEGVPGSDKEGGYRPIVDTFGRPSLILFTGKELEELAAIEALEHRVIVTPQTASEQCRLPSTEWRFTISGHYFYDKAYAEGKIGPLPRTDGSQSQRESQDYDAYFKAYVGSQYNHEDDMVKELSEVFVAKFPEQADDTEHYEIQKTVGYNL